MELPPLGWQTGVSSPAAVIWAVSPPQEASLYILMMATRSLSGARETSTVDASAVSGIGAGAGVAAMLAGRAPRRIMVTDSLRKCMFV